MGWSVYVCCFSVWLLPVQVAKATANAGNGQNMYSSLLAVVK